MDDEAQELADAPHANLVFIGPWGSGKSTTAGRLIVDCGAVDRQTVERIAQEATDRGREDRRYAWILDKLGCERDRGTTMYSALWRLASRRCRFTIIDAPGHADFTKDIVTAMSQAEIVVLVVAAPQDNSDEGRACEQQIREHALLVHTLGLRQLVVCVNKMDSEAVLYSEERFSLVCARVREDIQGVGLKAHDVHFDVHFVPVSGLTGDNVADRSANTPWYCGPTLLEALDDAVASHFKPDRERPLRLVVHEVMTIGGVGVVTVGRVLTGSLRPGTHLVFAPGCVPAVVKSVELHHETLDEAACGEDSVNITVNANAKELRRGMVGSAADEEESRARECSTFVARVIVLALPRSGEVCAGCVLWVECHAARVPCVFEELLSRTDRRTGKVLETAPTALHGGDAAVVRLRPQAALCLEPFGDYPPLGRFAVRDQKTTVAVGVVQQVEYAVPVQVSGSRPSERSSSKQVTGGARCRPPGIHLSLSRPKAHGRMTGRGRGDHTSGTDESPRAFRPQSGISGNDAGDSDAKPFPSALASNSTNAMSAFPGAYPTAATTAVGAASAMLGAAGSMGNSITEGSLSMVAVPYVAETSSTEKKESLWGAFGAMAKRHAKEGTGVLSTRAALQRAAHRPAARSAATDWSGEGSQGEGLDGLSDG